LARLGKIKATNALINRINMRANCSHRVLIAADLSSAR